MVEIEFPDTNGNPRKISVNQGEPLFILGANGSGKSSLVQRIFSQHKDNAKRISAHRQTWFMSNTLDFTPTLRKQTEQSLDNADRQESSRWRDDYASQRLSAAIFDLINADNVRSRKITEKIDQGALEAALAVSTKEGAPQIVAEALEETRKKSPLKVLNEILKTANLPIDIFIENDEQILATKDGSNPYSIAELSDGERNAVLISASVLTATSGILIVIDEPERHLHRSIISPLLSTLFQKRPDCTFIISTHDVFLPLDNKESATLLIRSCTWGGQSATGWDTDLIGTDADVSEDVKRAILGSRRTVLFTEGIQDGLDEQIYKILFPGISIVPKGNSVEVERATKGVRATESLNWVKAYGLIDSDDRTPDQVEELRNSGIYGLNCYSVESLYYHPAVISLLAATQAQVTGEDADELRNRAFNAALKAIRSQRDRLCPRVAERKIQRIITRELPDHKYIAENDIWNRPLWILRYRNQEFEKFDAFVENRDIEGLIARYPVRETQALSEIASRLGFQNRGKYEMAVRKMLIDDEGARKMLKCLLGDLATCLDGK